MQWQYFFGRRPTVTSSQQALSGQTIPAVGQHSGPLLTYTLVAILLVVFIVELVLGGDPPSLLLQRSIRTLAELGGSSWALVVTGGEWYRLVSAPFLHGSLIHLLLNCCVLAFAGARLETIVGGAWFAAIYSLSAILGVLASLYLNPIAAVSVGASGAIMGVLAALFVLSFHFKHDQPRRQLQILSLQVLIPSLIPIGITIAGQHVDYGAHAGGAFGGLLLGVTLLSLWPRTERLPRLRWLGWTLAIVVPTVVMLPGAINSLAKARHQDALHAMLIPPDQYPANDEAMKSQVEFLVRRFPHDPRARLHHGTALLDAGDFTGAERELRAGLAEEELLRTLLPTEVTLLLRTNLAIVLYATNRLGEAKTVAEPVCRVISPMRETLKSLEICK